jgi:hypothetical protein
VSFFDIFVCFVCFVVGLIALFVVPVWVAARSVRPAKKVALPLGMRLGQIDRRRAVIERRLGASHPDSHLYCDFEDALLKLDAEEDALLAEDLERVAPRD